MLKCTCFFGAVFVCICTVLCEYVPIQELDERFLQQRHQGAWLVEFYSPWCIHCKDLEPVYEQVAKHFQKSPITVAKIDATYVTQVASEFDVRGFPTIKFFKGDKIYTYRGDRTVESIIEFSNRALGPSVRPLTSIGKFREAKEDKYDSVFFIYIGEQNSQEELYETYNSVSEKMAIESYFYSAKKHILPNNVKTDKLPTVLVFKDDQYFAYSDGDLESWMTSEKFLTFPKISGGQLNEMTALNKHIVIGLVDDETHDPSTSSSRVKGLIRMLAFEKREMYHRDFQFSWTADQELIRDILMWTVPVPHIIILDAANQTYFLPEDDMSTITLQELETFLMNVKSGKIKPFGGTGIGQRLFRVFFDLFMTFYSMWRSSPWVFPIIVGIPTCLVTTMFYVLCCAPYDDVIHEDWSDSENEDKEEVLEEDNHDHDEEQKKDR